MKRFVDGSEKDDLLLDSILLNSEILLAHVWDISPIAIAGNDRDAHKGRFQLDGLIGLGSFSVWIFGGGGLSLLNRFGLRWSAASLSKTKRRQDHNQCGGGNAN